MGKLNHYKFMIACLVGLGVLVSPSHSFAATSQDECSQEVLLSYFPGIFVNETLKNFNVPENKWSSIVTDLAAKDKEILKKVEAKAAKMNPNPLKDPQQRQAAVKLFRETLLENFASVMKRYGVEDDKQIQEMLDDLQQQKAKSFARCMQKEQEKTVGTDEDEDSDEDNDEDENNEDEDDEDFDDDEDEDEELKNSVKSDKK